MLFPFLAFKKYFLPPTINGSATKIVKEKAKTAAIINAIPKFTLSMLKDFIAS